MSCLALTSSQGPAKFNPLLRANAKQYFRNSSKKGKKLFLLFLKKFLGLVLLLWDPGDISQTACVITCLKTGSDPSRQSIKKEN